MKNLINKMKFNAIIWVVIIGLALQLSSCAKEKKAQAKTKDKEIIASDTVFDRKSPYYSFIQKNHPEALSHELVYFKVEDIDLDGKQEAIVALGKLDKEDENNTEINQIFLLRKDNGIIESLYDFEKFCYSIYNIGLVSLQGKKEKCICLYTKNYTRASGFHLFELLNNKVINLCSRLSFSRYINNYLVDNDKDGKYDGYEQFLTYTYALFYDVTRSYVFKKGDFKWSKTHVEIPSEYPDTINEILLQYISLRSLNLGESKEVSERLNLICTNQNVSNIKWNKAIWGKGYEYTYLGMEGQIEFEIQEGTYTTIATYIDEDQKAYQCQFEVAKTADKWQITKVTITKNGDEEINK